MSEQSKDNKFSIVSALAVGFLVGLAIIAIPILGFFWMLGGGAK